MIIRFRAGRLLLAAVLLGGPLTVADAATFAFARQANGVSGLTSAQVSADGVAMTLSAMPEGAVLDERSSGGLGVTSRSLAGVTDAGLDTFNVLGGTAPVAGQGESITFSFDQRGVLTALDLDGVKDESFEFFRLEVPGGEVLSIFDSQIGLRLVDLSLIDEPNVTLLSEIPGEDVDDDLFGLSIPFRPGEQFRLTYGEYTPDPSNYQPGFTPETPNGARFSGVTVQLVPEPSAAPLIGLWAAGLSRRVRRTFALGRL